MADAELIALIADGHADAFAEIYDRLAPRAFGLARRILSGSAAEEVLQEAFLAVWRGASRFDAEHGSAAGWVLAITRNRSLDRLRHERARPASAGATGDRVGDLPSGEVALADRVVHDEDALQVHSAVARLPPEQRSVVLLAYFDGCTGPEIAARLGIPLGTAKSRMRLALAKLGETLDVEVAS